MASVLKARLKLIKALKLLSQPMGLPVLRDRVLGSKWCLMLLAVLALTFPSFVQAQVEIGGLILWPRCSCFIPRQVGVDHSKDHAASSHSCTVTFED